LLRTEVHVAYTVLIVLFHALGWNSVTAFAAAPLLANLVLVVTAVALAAAHGWARPRRPAAAREIVSFGSRVQSAAVVQGLGERLDQIVISVLLTAASLGFYVVAMTVARLITVPASTFATLAFPKIARTINPAEQARIFGSYLRATIATSLVGLVAVLLCADWVLSTFFGPTFGEAAGLTRALAAATFLLAGKTIVSAGLKGVGELRVISYGEIAGLVTTMVSLACLLPTIGIMGAAVAAVLGQAASVAVMVHGLPRNLGFGVGALLRPTAREMASFAKPLAAVGLWWGKR
jgi:O-antigen/teichoic acid export membrane protein